MIYGSVCSGIEAATVAWHPLGWRPSFFSEIEAFPRAVLAHHYPQVPCHGDFTTIEADEYEPIDLLVGGTPCQSFSVAGLRGGLADDRGNLALEFLRLADRTRPRWLVWENVPGVLSSDRGRDFGSILGGLVELGYGFAYRVLDAQFFGVPQRRRRVFVVGYLGDWRPAAAVLFERDSLQGYPAPRREAGQGVARPIAAGSPRSSGYRNDADTADNLVAFGGNNCSGPVDVAAALQAHPGPAGRMDFASETFVAFNITPSNSNKDFNARQSERAQALTAGGNRPSARGGDLIAQPVAFDTTQVTSAANRSNPKPGDPCHPLAAGAHPPAVALGPIRYGPSNQDTLHHESGVLNTLPSGNNNNAGHYTKTVASSAVRRLTPRECERLQGFPDGYTDVPHRGKPAADGPRYKALGNSMAVPVMRWIGERISLVEASLNHQREAA